MTKPLLVRHGETGQRLGVVVVLDSGLREIDVGSRQGFTWPETRHRALGLDASGPFGNCTVWSFGHEGGVLRALD